MTADVDQTQQPRVSVRVGRVGFDYVDDAK